MTCVLTATALTMALSAPALADTDYFDPGYNEIWFYYDRAGAYYAF